MSTFSTLALISVHHKILGQLSQPICLQFSHGKFYEKIQSFNYDVYQFVFKFLHCCWVNWLIFLSMDCLALSKMQISIFTSQTSSHFFDILVWGLSNRGRYKNIISNTHSDIIKWYKFWTIHNFIISYLLFSLFLTFLITMGTGIVCIYKQSQPN